MMKSKNNLIEKCEIKNFKYNLYKRTKEKLMNSGCMNKNGTQVIRPKQQTKNQ